MKRRAPLSRRHGAVCCIACGVVFASYGNLRSHWTGGLQPLWQRALRRRREALS
jgi:hypothetical protein